MATREERLKENADLKKKILKLDPKSKAYARAVQRINYNRDQMGIARDFDPNRYIASQQKAAPQTKLKQTPPKDRAPVDRPVANVPVKNAKTQKELLANEQALADKEVQRNIQSQNAGYQSNPFGNQRIWTDAQGNVHVDANLSADQQGILDRDEALSLMGRNLAQERLQSGQYGQEFDPLGSGNAIADRQRIEDAVFSSLTRDMDYNKNLEMNQFEQTMRNRGIPLGSDLYNQEKKRLEDKYQGISDNARQTAIAQGGAEFQRNYEIERATRNQNLGEIGTFSQFGTGQQTPQFQGYQGVGYELPNATDVYSAVNTVRQGQTALNQNQQQLDMQRQQMARMGGGGGGSSQNSGPFNNTPMPGA